MGRLKLLLFALLFVAADQLTKFVMAGKEYVVIKKFFELKYTLNYGAAFGLLQGQRIFFIIAAIAVIVFVFLEFPREKNYLRSISFILLFSGAIGNLIDRVYFGYVRDFISLWVWPNFNLADAFLTIGVLVMLLSLLKRD